MLPEGFKWRQYKGEPTLYLDGKRLATITLLVNGQHRVCYHPANLPIRYDFCDSKSEAVICVEVWAAKWESRLRRG